MPPSVSQAAARPLFPAVSFRKILAFAYPHPALWFFALGLFAFNCIWLAFSAKMSVEPKWLLISPALAAGGVAIAYARIAFAQYIPQPLLRPSRYIMTILAAGILFNNLRVFNALAMTVVFPMADGTLQGWDEALGFNWLAYVKALLASPAIANILFFCYNEITFKFPALILAVLVINDAHHRVREMGFLLAVTAVVCITAAAVFPAITPYFIVGDAALNQLLASAINAIPPQQEINDQIAALRSADPVMLIPAQIQGLSAFPSFHTAMAIIIAWTCRGPWWTTLFGAAAGLGIVVGTPLFGNHYLVDVLAGAAVCVLAILTWRRWASVWAAQAEVD
jgi:PAP2 superfamily